MKLDMNRPKGQVYGHSSAIYEQDGKLFDGAGVCISDDEPETKPVSKSSKPEPAEETPAASVDCMKFLAETLHGAAMSETKLYKACEDANLNWTDVKNAANEMNIRKYRQGSATMWKLMIE